MNDIIKILSQESGKLERDIVILVDDVTRILIKEGCEITNPKFSQYLVRRLRKRLKIEESTTYLTFKEFFKEK